MTTPEHMPRPPMTGVHHVAITVTDMDTSTEWYRRVFGLEPIPVQFPHHASEHSGYGRLLTDPGSGIVIGLHHHRSNDQQPADETRAGLDHFAVAVAARSDLDSWASWFDSLGVANSGVIDAVDPIAYSVVVLRDPDNIQLEMVYLPQK